MINYSLAGARFLTLRYRILTLSLIFILIFHNFHFIPTFCSFPHNGNYFLLINEPRMKKENKKHGNILKSYKGCDTSFNSEKFKKRIKKIKLSVIPLLN